MRLVLNEDYKRAVDNFIEKLVVDLTPADSSWIRNITSGVECNIIRTPSTLAKKVVFASQSLYEGKVIVLYNSVVLIVENDEDTLQHYNELLELIKLREHE